MSSSSSCSMRLRTMNVLRSRSIPAAPPGSVTTSWRNLGITDRAVTPRQSGRTGTSRQATTAKSFVVDDALDRRLGLLGGERLDRQERQPDGVLTRRRQDVAELAAQEAVGHLDEDPGAVAGVGLGSGGAPVVEVGQRREGGVDQLAAGDALQMGDEGDAARVVLEAGVVQAVTLRGPAGDVLHSVVVLVHESRWSAWVVPGTTLARTVNTQSRGSAPPRAAPFDLAPILSAKWSTGRHFAPQGGRHSFSRLR